MCPLRSLLVYQLRVQTQTPRSNSRQPNGSALETTSFDRDPCVVHEREQSEVEIQFPSHVVNIPEDNVSIAFGRKELTLVHAHNAKNLNMIHWSLGDIMSFLSRPSEEDQNLTLKHDFEFF